MTQFRTAGARLAGTRNTDAVYDTISLELTLASQARLEELCLPTLEEAREIFQPNEAYGHDLILKGYSGLPRSYQLKIAVPHGIESAEHASFFGNELVPVVTCYTEERAEFYKNIGYRNVWTIAAPFLYCRMLMADRMSVVPRSGTIFFPAHSGPLGRAVIDYESLLDSLASLPDSYKPITVCMYYHDLNQGMHLPFRDRGYRIVSAGFSYDPLFLQRLIHLLSMYKYAASNSHTSAIYYSIFSGCRYFYLAPTEPSWIRPGGIPEDLDSTPSAAHARLLEGLEDLTASSDEEQLEYAKTYLGFDHILSPDALREFLMKAERLDRWGSFSKAQNGTRAIELPARYRRTAHKVARRLMRGRK